jgi:hypothetical protein
MFDYLYCKKELPLCGAVKDLKINWKKVDFQTKDLDCIMDTYEITAAGQLKVRHARWRLPDDEDGVKKPNPRPKNVNYTGSINFYTNVYSDTKYNSLEWGEITDEIIEECEALEYWVEFVAIFHNGKLEALEWFKTDIHPVKEQLINQKKWNEERMEKESKLGFKIKKTLRKVPGYRKLIKGLQRFVSFQSKIVNKLYY